MNISEFIEWFLNKIVEIASTLLNYLDNIYLTNNVSMLDFIITLAIISTFIGIIITLPQNINNKMRIEKKGKLKNDTKSRTKNGV